MAQLPTVEEADLLVVGSGAAGSLVAAKAARAGKQVLILEAGPERTLNDLISSQIWARRLKWGGAPVEERGNLKIGHVFNSGYGTGGGALHHYAVWPRLHLNDFKVNSTWGKSLDWPIEYQDLQPYYDRIQAEVGISGDAEAEKWRPPGEPYPLPALPVFAQGQVIGEGFRKMGRHVAPIPMAINSRPYKGRSVCLYDGWCDAGCPIGALANPLALYLPQAFAAGADIKHRATVSRLTHDQTGRRVTGAEYFDAQGKMHRVRASQIALCAFAVQNARLLLNSKTDKHPKGLANSNDQVGRYLMTHPARTIYGLFEKETQPHLGPTGGQLICHDHYRQKQRQNGFGSYQWLIANAAKPNGLVGIANTRPDLTGANLRPFMRRAVKYFGHMNFVGEDIALAENRITLSSNKDQYGVPLASTEHSITDLTQSTVSRAVAEGLAIFKAGGAKEPWTGPPFGMHILGGTVMGSVAEKSVCDDFGRCHELDNLYIAGPGVFPSSGAVNPTFTIHALALRTVENLLATG